MKAILLAAGVGSRIAENIGNIPKSMMYVGGKPLIIHTVELLQKNHMEVILITGFKHHMIEDTLKDYNVKVYYNPFYAVTNSMGSLWYAREEFGTEDVFIANADVFYTQELLDKVIEAKYDNFLLSDMTRAQTGDYFFRTEGGLLKKYGKGLTREERNAEYVGIAVLRKDWILRFRDRLCSMIEAGDYDLWWENVLYSFVDTEDAHAVGEGHAADETHVAEETHVADETHIAGEGSALTYDTYDIHTVDVDGIFWSEIDTISDYERVVEYCRTV